MSLPPQVTTDKSGKQRAAAMKEQHSGEVYYGMGPPNTDSAGGSGVYNPEKGPQNVLQYQQAAPVKWLHQDSIQAPGWSQEVAAWGPNFGSYMSGVNARGQMAFHKGVHEGVALPMGAESQLAGPAEVYREATQAPAQGRGLEWDQAMHQAYQHGHKGVELQGQPHAPSAHSLQGSMLQPFQPTFRPSKQQFSSGYYSVFPGNKAIPNMAYSSEQPKSQQQLLHQMQQHQQQQQQQQQMHHHHHQQQQQQQQQQLHQQHQLQLQQQQQHLQQQQQQQQIQQQQIQQRQLQMQQQYHQQQLQERQQQMQQMQQQMQQQNVPQQETGTTTTTTTPPLQSQGKQTQNFTAYVPPELRPLPDAAAKKEVVQDVKTEEATDAASAAAPRRSRRLSREGQSPLGPPPANIWAQPSKEPPQTPPPQNGVTTGGCPAGKAAESQGAAGGVIQVTRRRRRASKEINLETLAQKASEMLPAKIGKDEGPSGRHASMVPLVIPVSVPVHRIQPDAQGGWTLGRHAERSAAQSDRKPSVIVSRRRSLRNNMTDSFGQDGENDGGLDEDGRAKFKRRPRPEPLIIPPPIPSTFIPPSVYSSITSYQSNLRSPIRLPDNPLSLPPYTPPPILSPVREGTGLYFSTFLTSIAASNQIFPPPPTPKSASRSLLRSTSSDITPPVLPLISDATPVSHEPRINIGLRYQAEIPDLRDQLSSQLDEHKADLLWTPLDDSALKHGDQESMVELMNVASSSVLRGGGTNPELALHCLHECGGDFIETLERLMLQDQVFHKEHHLADYHYSGSDNWTAEEKRYFNKGISAYRKDFILVQQLVRTKTVAQCVEFYYTYKKQVKVGRSSALSFGPPASPVEKHLDAVVDVKSSQQSRATRGEADHDEKKEVIVAQSLESSQKAARVAQSLQAHDYAAPVLLNKELDSVSKPTHEPSPPRRPRADPAAKKSRAPPPKPPQDPDAVFPCKKCGRIFYKVKSRSAHMKSHAEQEKKAAALRQRAEEERAAAQARKAAEEEENGVTEQAEVSEQDESSERDDDDDDDEDWH